MLTISDVTKYYISKDGDHILAVDSINFGIDDGEFVSIVGPSGCGKSTLLMMCAGLVEPTCGQLDYLGTGVRPEPAEYGFVFQKAALLPWRKVLDNLMLPATIRHLDKRESLNRARELLDLVQLSDIEDKYPAELSGGMQQRVAIARALLVRPNVLFMDEPFGALDALTRTDMGFELLRIREVESCAVLFVTHSISEAVLLSDRVLVMSASPGRIVGDYKVALPKPRDADAGLSDAFKATEQLIRHDLAQWGKP